MSEGNGNVGTDGDWSVEEGPHGRARLDIGDSSRDGHGVTRSACSANWFRHHLPATRPGACTTNTPRSVHNQHAPERAQPTRPGACTTNSPRSVHNQLAPERAQPTRPGTCSARIVDELVHEVCLPTSHLRPMSLPKGPRPGAPPPLVSANARASAGGVPPSSQPDVATRPRLLRRRAACAERAERTSGGGATGCGFARRRAAATGRGPARRRAAATGRGCHSRGRKLCLYQESDRVAVRQACYGARSSWERRDWEVRHGRKRVDIDRRIELWRRPLALALALALARARALALALALARARAPHSHARRTRGRTSRGDPPTGGAGGGAGRARRAGERRGGRRWCRRG